MNNIVLIGMPACGKSTAGVLLAKTAGMNFIDTDLLIQQRNGSLLSDIIDSRGIDGFLAAEEEVLLSITTDGSVIATGGSAVYSEKGMEHLKKNSTVIYIEVSLQEIENRINNIKTRGVVMKDGETLEKIYEERIPLYEKYADVTINTTNTTEMDLEDLVETIINVVYAEK